LRDLARLACRLRPPGRKPALLPFFFPNAPLRTVLGAFSACPPPLIGIYDPLEFFYGGLCTAAVAPLMGRIEPCVPPFFSFFTFAHRGLATQRGAILFPSCSSRGELRTVSCWRKRTSSQDPFVSFFPPQSDIFFTPPTSPPMPDGATLQQTPSLGFFLPLPPTMFFFPCDFPGVPTLFGIYVLQFFHLKSRPPLCRWERAKHFPFPTLGITTSQVCVAGPCF